LALISDVTAGSTIDPSWGNAVRDATVQVTTSGARPTVPAEGMVIYETDTDRLMAYTGSAWVRVSHAATGGRTGCTVRRNANQSISTDTRTNLSFDVEDADTDGFFAPTSTTVTIPANLGGLYAVSFTASAAVTLTTTAMAYLFCSGSAVQAVTTGAGANDNGFPLSGSRYYIGCATTLILAAGDTIVAGVYQNSGLSMNVTGRLSVYRVGV
jgi:hypothetical protein